MKKKIVKTDQHSNHIFFFNYNKLKNKFVNSVHTVFETDCTFRISSEALCLTQAKQTPIKFV